MPSVMPAVSEELLLRDVVTWASPAGGHPLGEWALLRLSTPQFVRRIRFRNGAGLQQHIQDRGIRAYSARYRSLRENEPKRSFGPPATNFGNPLNFVPLSEALLSFRSSSERKPLRGAWTVWQVPEPVLTDEVAIICHEPGSVFSAIAEIELYGISQAN